MSLEGLIKDVFNQPDKGLNITIYTGIGGMISWDWAMAGIGGFIPVKYWTHHTKRTRQYLVSLVTKHGNLKAVISYNSPTKVSLRVGTKEVMRTNDLSDVKYFVEKYKDFDPSKEWYEKV
jgi:hypothetical protein